MTAVTFTPAEAQEIVRALAAIAAADGAIKSREEAMLESFAVAHGIGGHGYFSTPLDEVALARAVSDPDKRREVVRLCVRMALSDNEYAAPEQQLVFRVARALGIDDDETAKISIAARKK